MTFRVHRRILSKLSEVDNDKDKLEAALWAATGEVCFLCEDSINRAADDCEADHDEAESVGGETSLANLHLAHATCNRMKRAANSRHIRPFIKFSRFLSKLDSRIKYDGAVPFFDIKPLPTDVTIEGAVARLSFPDGSERTAPVMHEKNEAAEFRFIYVDVLREAIYNDEDCQPRVIKREQAGAIYGDIRRNPLHEPPSVRLGPSENGMHRLLMFDGQHKTIASWLYERDRVVV